MKDAFRRTFEQAAPALLGRLRRVRAERYQKREEAREKRVLESITRNAGYVVQSGPFKGMKYVKRTRWPGLAAKLLGVYERELHSIVEKLLSRPYDVAINIGSAEGYYAVGFACRGRPSQVVAYDIDAESRVLCGEMAALNDVAGRVTVLAECTPQELQRRLTGRALVISDCEGGELELLDPVRVPALAHADILVELHEFRRTGVRDATLARFRHTHEIEIVAATARRPEEAQVERLNASDRYYAIDEGRPEGMEWAVMLARGGQ